MGIKLDGKALADKICKGLKEEVVRDNLRPKLTIVTTGDDTASKVYVRNKIRRCEEIGIECQQLHFDEINPHVAYSVWETSKGGSVILQLPAKIDKQYTVEQYVSMMTGGNPLLDADGFTDANVSALFRGETPDCAPCTPAGIMRLLNEYDIDVTGKHVLIINRSNIVGKPLTHLMLNKDATVTVAHSKSDISLSIGTADIIIEATGHAKWIKSDVINKIHRHQILVDVTMTHDENGKLCGGFDPSCYNYCKAYTPVPGGVGPMTVAMLMENVVKAARK